MTQSLAKLSRMRTVLCGVLLLLIAVPQALGHAILLHSIPADNAVVYSHQLDLVLEYNARIDVARCMLTLTGSSGINIPVQKKPSAKPSELRAFAANLKSGFYHLHWQVLAGDGHITRGEIAFTVADK